MLSFVSTVGKSRRQQVHCNNNFTKGEGSLCHDDYCMVNIKVTSALSVLQRKS